MPSGGGEQAEGLKQSTGDGDAGSHPLRLTQPGLIFLSNSPGAAAFSCLKTSRLMPLSQTPSATRSSQLDIHPQSRSKTELLMPRDATQACQMLHMCPHISKHHILPQRAGDEHENLSLSHPASPCSHGLYFCIATQNSLPLSKLPHLLWISPTRVSSGTQGLS